MVSLILGKFDPFVFYALLRNRDPAEHAELVDKCDKAMAALENFYESSEGPYLLGDRLSAVEIAVAPALARAIPALQYWKGYELLSELAHPRLTRMWLAVQERPAFKATTCDPDLFVDFTQVYTVGKGAGPLPANAVYRTARSHPVECIAFAAAAGAGLTLLLQRVRR
mmetsp:Transcript_25428/g.79674  ORF Transcript_25428/g.79674 Transcript_25428/m.79674 type:complete len:168 (-) Transcript_25428:56-559(-)